MAPLLALNHLRRRSAPTTVRILVLEPWGIGDLVLATGALRSCRAAFPNARIAVLAKSHAQSLVISPELADEVVAYDFPWTAFTGKYRLSSYRFVEIARLILELRRARYDLVLNARADVRNNLLGALVGARRFVSAACGLGDLMATDVVDVGGDAHRVEDWAAIVTRATGAPAAQVEPRLTVTSAEREAMRSALEVTSAVRPIIGLHPGARIAVRRWELARFAAVADALAAELGATILVFAEPDGYGEAIPTRLPAKVVHRPLREIPAALSLCDVLVCNDSGPMHIAAALGVPVAAVFGPTRLEWFGPRGGPSRVSRIEEVACRPCFDVCKFSRAFCIADIGVREVVDAAISLLNAAPRLGNGPAIAAPLGARLQQLA